MFQNPDSWLVLLSLAITVVAIILWLREAGDDWLKRDADGRWSCPLHDLGTGPGPGAGTQRT